jgi:hypothetical protein
VIEIKLKEQEKNKKSPMKRILNYKNALKDRFNPSRIRRIKMIDNWTQTSDRGSENEQEEKKATSEDQSSLNCKTTDNTFHSGNLGGSPLSKYKRNNTSSKYKISMNSVFANNKTFRSPISGSIVNNLKNEQHSSFSLSKSKAGLIQKKNLESTSNFTHYRHNTSHKNSLNERFNAAQRKVLRSPQKSYNPACDTSSSLL